MIDPLKPNAGLLVKLGSIIVHQEEKASSGWHSFDQFALDTCRNDPEVIEWMSAMTRLGFLPVKR